MTVMLLANVGNRDVGVTRETPIPGEANPIWNEAASMRALGRAILGNWDACQPHVFLPIIGKVVDHIFAKGERIDRVILIASDQSEAASVSDRHLAQDTIELAKVVTRRLVEVHGLPKTSITTWTINQNPADYGGMQAFFRERLTALRAEEPAGRAYLEVSGGTPAMTSMLLTVGAEVFGLNAYPLYVSQYEETPFQLDLGRRVVAESLQDVIRENSKLYAYHAAARTLASNLELLEAFCPAEALHAVCTYAHQRLNFNFDEARAALELDLRHRSNPLTLLVEELRDDQPWWMLHEILFNAEVRLQTGAYGDFLVRVFRFDEGVVQYSAQRLGARLVDEDGNPDAYGEFFDPEWIERQPSLQAYFEKKQVRRRNDGLIPTNRFVLYLTVTHLARQHNDRRGQRIRKKLIELQKLSSVRNKSFAAHSFDGVSAKRIVKRFTDDVEAEGSEEQLTQVVEAMREVCKLATDQPVANVNPYDRINALIEDLLDA